MTRIETVVLSSLIHNEEYLRKVMPFLKVEYFTSPSDAKLFLTVKQFVDKYAKPPTLDALKIAANKDKNLTEEEHTLIVEALDSMEPQANDLEWLVDETEQFCKDKAVYNAIVKSINIIDGKDKKNNADGIPLLLEEALAVAFDNNVGHDFLEDAEERFEYYHNVEERIPFDLDMFNRITAGGIPKKTLNVIMAGVGVGKTLIMCHIAAAFLAQGKNVLYITLEMAAEEISKRIDTNLLNIPIEDLPIVSKAMFMERIEKVRAKTNGKLIVKEYPTSSAHAGHFSSLINELRIKKNFVPDAVVVDYLNICSSSRLKADAAAHTYTWVKAIAEEIRAMAVKHEVPVFTGTQTTRGGSVDNDPDMTDTSESFGLPATVDLHLAIVQDETLDELNQYLCKQLKNRYRDKAKDRRFIVGVDKTKMRLYDVEKSAQKGLSPEETTGTLGSTRKSKKPDLSKIKVD